MDSRINSRIIEANVKLQDENKLLQEDKEILQRRIDKAIEYLDYFYELELDIDNGEALDLKIDKMKAILKGEYVEEEK